MRNVTITQDITIELITEDCCNCGVMFGFTGELRKQRLADKATFYCPNGHPQSYMGKSMKEQLAEAKRATASAEEEARIQAARANNAERDAAAATREAQRLLKRASAGVCPCCERSFVQLSRHMKTKHPDAAT